MFACLKREPKKTEQAKIEHGCSGTDKKTPDLSKAEEIAKQYDQLKECCDILSKVGVKKERTFMMHGEGWRVWEHTVEGAGIDVEEVYDYIKKLATKRKAELECSLAKVDG